MFSGQTQIVYKLYLSRQSISVCVQRNTSVFIGAQLKFYSLEDLKGIKSLLGQVINNIVSTNIFAHYLLRRLVNIDLSCRKLISLLLIKIYLNKKEQQDVKLGIKNIGLNAIRDCIFHAYIYYIKY